MRFLGAHADETALPMKRSHLLTGLAFAGLLALSLAACAGPGAAVRHPGTAVVQVPLRWNNAYLVLGERPVLVDPGSPGDGDFERLSSALDASGLAWSDLSLVVLTHGHADHAGGAARVSDASGAPVLAGDADLALLRAGSGGDLHAMGIEARLIRPFVPKAFPAVEPDLTLAAAPGRSSLDLRPYGVRGTALLMPGHTEGSLVVVLDGDGRREAIVGDLFRGGIVGGRVDPHTPHRHYFHDDAERAEAAVGALLARGVSRFLPRPRRPRLSRCDPRALRRVRFGPDFQPLVPMNGPVLVTGATGRQGGAVARHLLGLGVPVRALTRNAASERARRLATAGAEVVAGDLDDAASLRPAVDGVRGVFSVQDYWQAGAEGEVRQARRLAEASARAGVDVFVQSTMATAATAPPAAPRVEHFETKREAERVVDGLGLPRVFLGTVYFMDNVLDPDMGGGRTFPALAGTLDADTPLDMVAVDDLGAVAARVLAAPDPYLGGRVDVAGDRLTVAEMKAAYGRATGERPKRWRIPSWGLRLVAREFYEQLVWHNAVNFAFDHAEARRIWPEMLSFETFVRRHSVRGL